ncbi:MAG: peptidoglycan-binding protein [Coleofasciculus sp. S288]|nr:peptidoglycan-binding protein [Coleofasciculus sp. S288]
METLASVHLSTTDEKHFKSVDCDLKLFEGFTWKLPSSAWIRVLSVILALSILGATTNALALGGTLHRGTRGSQVVSLQNRLKATGYFPSTVRSTGFYGSITENAVRKFQQARGLRVDGIAGTNTLSALGSTSGSSSLPTGTVLQRGSRGSAVTQLQTKLRTAGFFNGPITGYYGRLTQDAVSRFQRARGLRVDGVAGSNTLLALGNTAPVASNPPVTTSPPFAGDPAIASPPPTATQLRRGSRGVAVTQLQNRLKALGFFNGPVTGFYGQLTETAVKNFQRSRKLSVNGIAGPTTLAALQNTSPSGSQSPTVAQLQPVQPGSTGPAVIRLQTRLRDLGYYRGEITGSYGTLTEVAVSDFQRARGLTINGIAGSTTVAALQDRSSGGGSFAAIATLRRGSSGTRVRSLQARLIALGYYTGSVDGIFGSGTEAALKRFQQDNGLVASGIADASTFATLAPRVQTASLLS